MPSAETSLGFFQSVWTIFLEGGASGQSVFDEFVDMVLGAVFTRRHFEHVRDTEQSFLRIAVHYDLKRKKTKTKRVGEFCLAIGDHF